MLEEKLRGGNYTKRPGLPRRRLTTEEKVRAEQLEKERTVAEAERNKKADHIIGFFTNNKNFDAYLILPITTCKESNNGIGSCENTPCPGLGIILFKDIVHRFILIAFPRWVTFVDKLHHRGQVTIDVKKLFEIK